MSLKKEDGAVTSLDKATPVQDNHTKRGKTVTRLDMTMQGKKAARLDENDKKRQNKTREDKTK